ncbi:MAG: trypsin-like serine protease [Ruminococcus sp.]|nr:trypsin-like serine protease [Ruminococcus sp.]
MKTNVVNLKKTTAVVIAFVLMILSAMYAGNKSEAANSQREYKVFNAKTGQLMKTYTLDKLPTRDNSRSVIGTDDRVIDWNKSGVVKILNSTDRCSGFVVSDHVIATAAHCVYEYKKVSPNPKKISDILLFDTNGDVTMHATPVKYHVPSKYISSGSNNYDYALITVEEDLRFYACFDLGVPLYSFDDNNSVVTVTGFPGTIGTGNNEKRVNTDTEHMMYSGNGIVYDIKDSLIYYKADSSGGNSGGPVYITESKSVSEDEDKRRTYYTVVAIHTTGNNDVNYGTRITTDLIHFYKANSYINW